MAKCIKCGADTILYENDVPICVKCVDGEEGQADRDRQKEITPRASRQIVDDAGSPKP